MKGTHDFIVKSEREYNDSFTTEGGVEIFADRRFSSDRLANRIATVVETPLLLENCAIKKGYEVMIDPTIYMRQNYERWGRLENLWKQEDGTYKIPPGMVVLYRETPNDEWKGYDDNLMVQIKEEVVETEVWLMTVKETERTITIEYPNQKILDLGVGKGDRVRIKGHGGLAFWIEGKQYFWIRTNDVLAKLN